MSAYRALSAAAVLLAFVVVVMGAYVRLSDAGLGCPDWPFCYGEALPSEIADRDALAKAWKEMGHRYLAGTLGVAIVLLAIGAWRRRRQAALATAIVLLVALQATLGKWTVTMLLKPAIVTAHLLGGMTTLALLAWLALAQWDHHPAPERRALRASAAVALALLAVQIALGGWVSANYAALACPDLPLCRGQAMDFANAFHMVRDLGRTREGELLPLAALTAIHWTHRVFALVALAAVLVAAARAWPLARPLALVIGVLVLAQFALGVANVAAGLPLALAAAHNAGAALVLVALVVLNFFAFRGLRFSS
jgi:cytochrome c oxidase assembly protein subunit 15